MGKKEKVSGVKDQKILSTVFICQMLLMILSTVSIDLTVALVVSEISETPAMCTTTRLGNTDGSDCELSGGCPQIYVNLRRNGSHIILNNCYNTVRKNCSIDWEKAEKARCFLDECKDLTGTFNCNAGSCIDITNALDCAFHDTDPALDCSGRLDENPCIDIQGLFSCTRGRCSRIRSPYNCDRRCIDIPARNKNAIILSGDKVYMFYCESATDAKTTKEIWNESQETIMMASCYRTQNTSLGIEAFDCINGATLKQNSLPDLTNFTHLNHLHRVVSKPSPEIAPHDYDLTISNHSRLMINVEMCVDDKCNTFIKEYGKDGTDFNAPARFPCFYAENDPETVRPLIV